MEKTSHIVKNLSAEEIKTYLPKTNVTFIKARDKNKNEIVVARLPLGKRLIIDFTLNRDDENLLLQDLDLEKLPGRLTAERYYYLEKGKRKSAPKKNPKRTVIIGQPFYKVHMVIAPKPKPDKKTSTVVEYLNEKKVLYLFNEPDLLNQFVENVEDEKKEI